MKFVTETVINNKRSFIVILLISLPTFYFSGFVGGYLQDEASLGKELITPSDSLIDWKLSERAPFKYRILFKGIVLETSSLFFPNTNRSFYISYVIVSYIIFLTTLLTLYFFLRINGFPERLALLGLGIFLISPVVLMAYKIPVHLREDYLAYLILLVGLVAIYKNNIFVLIVSFSLGAICRETLLILPFTFLFFTKYYSLITRLVLSAIPAIILLFLRLILGYEKFDYFLGFKWNLANPIQVVGFSLITFHFMWVTLVVYLIVRKRISHSIEYMDKSLLPVLLLVIATTFIGGIFNEIRLLFLAFPWIIISALKVIENNRTIGFSKWFEKSTVKMFLIIQPVFLIVMFYLITNLKYVDKPSRDTQNWQWIALSLVYFELMLFSLIHYSKNIRLLK